METIKRFQITPGNWWVSWQNWNGVQMWHMTLEHKPQHIEVFLFAGIYIHLFSLWTCASLNWNRLGPNAEELKVTWVNTARQSVSQLTVTSKSIFQLTFFTPAAAFSISIQVTDPFGYWCITAFMSEYSDCKMWSWHSAAGTLRCQSRFKIPDMGRCVFLFWRF